MDAKMCVLESFMQKSPEMNKSQKEAGDGPYLKNL